ncbi:uncharacterized protein EV422DRAFT_48701 [Fimicolochytrium jonesii]|uniref:uncharacterized protein n=1 Tax=Fimicolochytrium jonesii TaxID=1396493 RepID=UPI0022FDE4A6|nr:uncharacterized protein EV422DRAFT_48701 [Fimicolochytrium jonesii]KAI8820996.1 hypothetical protein EV422DRAFT_48701 [Fimicolochytrium jonesii]
MSSHSALSSVIIHEGMDDIEETISDLIEQGRLQSEALQAAADALAEREKKWVEKRSHTMMVSTQNIKKVKFDVGGRIFSISLDALLACKGLMFESLFSEGWGPQAGYDGTIFIDRDPAAYEFIFNYLRAQATGTKLPIPQDSLAREALKKEADFLCLADLTEALKTPPPSKTPPRSNKPPSLPLGAKRTACCPQCHHPNDYFYGIGTWNPHLNYYICNQCDLKFNVIQHQIAERVLT